MNWIEKKWKIEQSFPKQAPPLWDKLRGHIQDACDSYNAHYASEDGRVKCEMENGRRVKVQRMLRCAAGLGYHDELVTALISFAQDRVSVAGDPPIEPQEFLISSDGEAAFFGRPDHTLDTDEISRRILEPLLFPKKPWGNVQ